MGDSSGLSLAAVVAFLARGRILLCLLERLCPRVVDGLAAPLGEATSRDMTEAWSVERLMRAAPRRTESEERLRRLPISPASSPEPSNVEEESEEEAVEWPMERAHSILLDSRSFLELRTVLGRSSTRRTFKSGKLKDSSDPTLDIHELSEVL